MKREQLYGIPQKPLGKGIRKYIPFIFCFIIASVLWFTREMGKTYEEQIEISVFYENVPKALVIVSEVPKTLTFSVEGTGWGILYHYIFGKEEIKVDVSDIVASNYLKLNTKDPRILSSISDLLKVIDVYPKEISFGFETINSKKVPVKTDVTLEFVQQYEKEGDLQIIPDSVYVYGSKKVLSGITEVVAQPFTKKKIRESFEGKIALEPIPNVIFSDDSVTIQAVVEKFTEQTVSIPVKLLNVPEGIVVDLMDDKVSLTFLIGMSKVQSYYSSDFEAVADFEKRSVNGTIPIEIVRAPQFVRIINQNPINDGVITNFTVDE